VLSREAVDTTRDARDASQAQAHIADDNPYTVPTSLGDGQASSSWSSRGACVQQESTATRSHCREQLGTSRDMDGAATWRNPSDLHHCHLADTEEVATL